MKKFLFNHVILLSLLTFFAFSFIQCGNPSSSKVRIGYLPIAAQLPLYVAIEQGYFKDEGIEVELTRFNSSNELGNAGAADKIDVLSGVASSVVFDIGSVSGKKDLVFITNPYSNIPNHVTDFLVVKKNSSIKEIKDLKGKKVASFPGSVNKAFCYMIFEKYGVSRDSIEYIELQPKDWQTALATGQVDAISALEPTATQIIADSVGRSIFSGFYADLMEDVPLSGQWIASDFYNRSDKNVIKKIVNAYNRAVDFCRNNEDSAKKYLVKYANVREDILKKVNLNPWKKLDEINLVQFQKYIDLIAENKAILNRVDIKDYVLPIK